MKLSCQEGMVPGKTLEEKLARSEQYGFEGIEFGGSGLAQRRREIARLTAKGKVKPSSICSGYRGCLLSPEPQDRLLAIGDIKELLQVSADIGAVGLIVVPIFGKPQLPDLSPYQDAVELERELLLQLLEKLSLHAEKVGSVVLLEPLNRYETHFVNRLEQAVEIVRKINSPGLKIMADFFHMSIEEANIPQAIREAGELIWHVHLADSNRLLPGWGHTDFKAGFQALREAGLDKYMALECSIPGDSEVDLPKTVKYLKGWM
ncbi:MAG: sugar phosphate isomerase/epimerase [Candidatus Latescibacteria bacterium]|nr:sugar phosphate isomerase/epimerase [Candidatus Latescibacterota bacterium]